MSDFHLEVSGDDEYEVVTFVQVDGAEPFRLQVGRASSRRDDAGHVHIHIKLDLLPYRGTIFEFRAHEGQLVLVPEELAETRRIRSVISSSTGGP